MRRAPRLLLLLLALAAPAAARANGGPSRWAHARMDGAALPGDGGRLEATTIVRDEEIECASEVLTIALGEDHAAVEVEYVLVNHGAARRIEYAFPFAIAEQEVVADGKTTRRVLGEPGRYSLQVNGRPVPAEQRPGLEVGPDLPVPAIDDNRDVPDVGEWTAPEGGRGELAGGAVRVENRYRFRYRVSPVDLPAGEPVRLAVRYTSPYLVYSKRNDETGSAQSPPAFSYLLSTGDGWRGGRIGRLTIRVKGTNETLPRYGIDGLPFTRKGNVATYEAQDVVPTPDMNLVIRRSDFAAVSVSVSPGKEPGAFELTPGPEAQRRYELRQLRFRLGVAPPADAPPPTRALVVLTFGDGTRDAFQATFGAATATAAQPAAGAGRRHLYFDAGEVPRTIQLRLLDVDAAAAARLRKTSFVLEQDATNYQAWVPLPR